RIVQREMLELFAHATVLAYVDRQTEHGETLVAADGNELDVEGAVADVGGHAYRFALERARDAGGAIGRVAVDLECRTADDLSRREAEVLERAALREHERTLAVDREQHHGEVGDDFAKPFESGRLHAHLFSTVNAAEAASGNGETGPIPSSTSVLSRSKRALACSALAHSQSRCRTAPHR